MDILSHFATSTQPNHFEAQQTTPGQRMCGAAALVMAYRRHDLDVDQQSIWKNISTPHNGSYRAHTFRMAQDAIGRGLTALIIQTHRPQQILQMCWRNNISAIINHRLPTVPHEGHFSVLAGITGDSIKLNDPLLGPAIHFSHDEFFPLWLPTTPQSEIAGNIVLAIGSKSAEPMVWSHCNQVLKETADCKRCGSVISLRPAIALGCWNLQCNQRLWYRLYCPQCDFPIHQI